MCLLQRILQHIKPNHNCLAIVTTFLFSCLIWSMWCFHEILFSYFGWNNVVSFKWKLRLWLRKLNPFKNIPNKPLCCVWIRLSFLKEDYLQITFISAFLGVKNQDSQIIPQLHLKKKGFVVHLYKEIIIFHSILTAPRNSKSIKNLKQPHNNQKYTFAHTC